MSLREKLKALEELQQIDLELGEVSGRLAEIPGQLLKVNETVAEARKAYDDAKARLESNERERRQIESLLGMERDKVKKWEGRLGEIRTPREYAALSREIDIAKKSNDTQYEQVKTLTTSAQDLQKSLDDLSDQLSEREMAAQNEVAELEKTKKAEETRAEGLESRRKESARSVDPALLAKYENIKRRRAGIAVAPVVGMTCKGCHRNIPPQLAITLQRANSIETCPNCHRIIYSAEAVNPPAAPPA